MASSVTAFAVASILFFPIGLLSGYFLHKKSGKMYIVSENSSTGERAQQVANDNDIGPNQELQLDLKDNGPSQPVPVYEDVLHIRSSASAVDYDRQHEEGLELREMWHIVVEFHIHDRYFCNLF